MKQNKFLLAAGLVMVLAALMVSPALAGSAPSTHTVTITSVNCSTGQVTVSITIADTGDFEHKLTITNSTTGASTIPHNVGMNNHGSNSFTETISGTLASISAGDTIQVSSLVATSYTMIATTTATCGGILDDGRINLETWSKAVAYCSDENGIKIYQGTKENKSHLLMFITAETLATYPARPAENTLIKKVGNVSLFKLTTGEYQMSVGPDLEGKTQVFIWRGCNRNTEYYHELQASIHAPYALMAGRRAS
jgi:hypothetical protein